MKAIDGIEWVFLSMAAISALALVAGVIAFAML
jgi:hypothetical protein